MNICSKGVIGKIFEISQPAIVKGSDGFIGVKLFNKDSCEPVTVNGFVGATGYLANEDDTIWDIPGELLSEDRAEIKFALPASGTVNLKASDEASFEVAIQDASGIKIVQFDGKLQIKDRLF